MPLKLLHAHHHHSLNLSPILQPQALTPTCRFATNLSTVSAAMKLKNEASKLRTLAAPPRNQRRRISSKASVSASLAPLDLTEDNIRQVLDDAKTELGQLFDTSVNITGKAELADLDGPYVKIRLSGRFWHKRSTVLARLGNYLMQRIPEILEVDIEDEKQLDDSQENF